MDDPENVAALASQDDKPIERIRDTEDQDSISPCDDCRESHRPRRVVCCIDGTWMGPDGAVGKYYVLVLFQFTDYCS